MMKKGEIFSNKEFYQILVIWTCVMIFFGSCGQNKPSIEENEQVGNTADSLISYFEQLSNDDFQLRFGPRATLLAQIKPNSTDSLIQYALKRAGEGNLSKTVNDVDVLNGYRFLWTGQMDSAFYLGTKAFEKANSMSDSASILACTNLLGSTYYMKKDLVNAKKFYLLGAEISSQMGSNYTSFLMYCNLGVIHRDYNQYGLAADYFMKALEQGKITKLQGKEKDKNYIETQMPMVWNNITQVLSDDQQYSKAESLWKQNNLDDYLDDTTYLGQLFTVNKGLLFLSLGRLSSAEQIFNRLVFEDIHSEVRLSYLRLYLKLRESRGITSKPTLFFEHIQEFYDAYPSSLNQFSLDLLYLVKVGHCPVSIQVLDELEASINPEDHSMMSLINLHWLRAELYLKAGSLQKAYDETVLELNATKSFYHQHDSIWTTDLVTQLENDRLAFEAEIKRQELKDKKQESAILALILVIVILVGAGIVFYAIQKRKKAELKFELKELELQKTESEREFLEKEQRMAGRVNVLSQVMIMRGNEIRKRLSSLSAELKNPELDKLRKELDQIIQTTDTSHPELADLILEENYERLEQTFGIQDVLNLTEKRILALSIEGYKGKEVANILGVSIQYVSNSRTKIRKAIKVGEEVEWAELKKRMFQNRI